MRPRFTSKDAADVRLSAGEQFGNFPLGKTSFSVVAYLAHGIGCQFRESVSSAYRIPSFVNAIRDIFCMRSNPQVPWKNTGWVVTSMADAHSWWEWPMRQHPCQTVGEINFPVKLDSPVAVAVQIPLPQPAAIYLLNKRPKASLVSFGQLCQWISSQIRTHITGLVRAPVLTQSIPVLAFFNRWPGGGQ